ncbi:MAG: archaeal proteasome endopeptidase complex subunit alpha [Sulfolobales archaeon]|nr:archaeal proteasome endopeptidase complex subunit alpha [Sulfolobales archaeon]MCX8185836.1 archaeal proteasome endopeptidase complex subunit alpha [Sulfolobales archaeon]MDW7969093.1 archaeal proteasome endopeptidase complex subunit alpha [Sulfolobales archaeon]
MAFGPPAMGYDRAITVFSPDGKLYQVEYAAENVRKGWTTIGIKSRDGGIILAEKKKVTQLVDLGSIEKIFLIDTHVGASFAGLAADGRILIDYARKQAFNHRFIYDEPADVEMLVRSVCDIKQLYTQHAGVRPFGVSLIFLGVDRKGVNLFKTETNGYYFSYLAIAMGAGEQSVMEFLEKNYDINLDMRDAVILGLKALRNASEGPLIPEGIELGYINLKEKEFRKLPLSELSRYIVEAGVNK